VTSARKIALVTGVLFIITIIASIPAQYILYAPVLDNADYIISAGADSLVQWGAFLEVITALACIGTAVVLFPIVKRQNESVALGYVAVRVLEAAIIFAGIVSLISVVALRQGFAGAADTAPAPLLAVGKSLVAVHDSTFLLGPGILAGLGNGILLGYLMYSSGLVPQRIALLALIGGPLVSASGIAMLLGLYEPVSLWAVIATIPEFIWELLLSIWLIVKGFNPSAKILSELNTTDLNGSDEESGKLSLSKA
jgi:Domain of unknown function (DUF4386)